MSSRARTRKRGGKSVEGKLFAVGDVRFYVGAQFVASAGGRFTTYNGRNEWFDIAHHGLRPYSKACLRI